MNLSAESKYYTNLSLEYTVKEFNGEIFLWVSYQSLILFSQKKL